MGPHDSRDAVNLQRRVVKRPIVLPSEIMNLPKLHGFLKLPGALERARASFERVLAHYATPGAECAKPRLKTKR